MSKFTSGIKRYYSCRWRICYACTVALLIMQTLRVDLSMSFVCMLKRANRTNEEVNVTTNNQYCSGFANDSFNPNIEGEFEWSDTLQSNILAGYFYGYMVTNIFGGALANKYGGKITAAGSILSTSILAILHPSLTRINGYFMLALRILTGMASGPIFPAVFFLIGRWAPPEENGVLIGLTFAGQILGNIVAFPTSSYLCVYGFDNGWGSIFYIFGGLSLVFGFVWMYVVYDNPDVHPAISEEERFYLNDAIKCKNAVQKVPWKRLLSSPAVWAINIGLFAYNWIDMSFQTLLPLYMKEALNIKTTSNGLMSSAPSMGQMFALPICGKFADILRSKKYLSNRSVRVLFQTFSMVTSACILITIGFLRCDQTILISVLFLLSGITLSFSSGGVIPNNIDIAPSFAGVVYSIANAISALSGSISSLTTKALTPNGTQEEWQIVLSLYSGICVFGAIIFAILARGEIQEWAIIGGSDSSGQSNDAKRNKTA
ncbi:uncharacterized transporter slc-17.2-like [Octopus sinensis]|uniref:Uncharacterized transporter slc-17.2-like n=1 Tax=Octopus sinensis TaxID=2607531 RepID=A0A6P7TMU2_9MOLL|nr:uncharacterized transporter slc-17.2-like [Octopus sinensis]